jgi:CHAT domain-containing protein
VPLHAAGIYTGPSDERVCCQDYLISSYTPSLSALLRARTNLSSVPRTTLNILGVAEGAATGMPILFNVTEEVRAVRHIAKSAHVNDISVDTHRASGTTVRAVLDQLPRANILHLACHGVQDILDPLKSGFCLGDGMLTISQLVDIELPHAFLAVLGACETAKGDRNQPDQTIHLAAAILMCGFRSVIGTLW